MLLWISFFPELERRRKKKKKIQELIQTNNRKDIELKKLDLNKFNFICWN